MMFSEDDIKRLCITFPPDTRTPLRAVRSNSGFANSNRSQLRVSKLIGLAPGSGDVALKIKLSEVAEKLDLQDGIIERLLPWGESGWLLAEDKTIITRTGYQALCKALFAQADEEPIVVTAFTKNNSISENTFRKLVEEINTSLSSNDAEVVQDYLLAFWGQHDELAYSKRYRRWLEEEVATILKAADRYSSAPEGLCEMALLTSRITSPKTIVSSTFQGDPPGDFLEYVANDLCETNYGGVDGHISRNLNGEIEFIPYTYLVTRREELLQHVREGKLPFLQYADLTRLDPRIADAGRFANDQLGEYAIPLVNSMASKAYFEHLVGVIESDLERRGWACVRPDAKLDAEDMDMFLSSVRRHVEGLHKSPKIRQILPRLDYLLLADWVEKFHETIDGEVHYLAQEHWNKGCDLKFPWPLVCEAVERIYLDLDTGVVRVILEQRKVEAEAVFTRHIQKFQEYSILKFSHAWKEKVLSLLQLYRIGVQNLGDAKLREELHSTLLDYTIKTLVPEFLQKRGSKGLIRGRSLERSVEKLQQALAGIKAGMGKLKDPFASTMEAIDAFGKAIKLEVWADEELGLRKAMQLREMVERKWMQLREMANNMKRDEDGPRLFLTLVLVMHGAHRPGIVYSTGKYIPRLLKQLTDVIDTETYAWMQRMKEAAKSGTMTSGEKAEIRARAALVCRVAVPD